MYITGVGTAAPEARYTQAQCWAALRGSAHFEALGAPARALLERILLGDSGIEGRHLALERLEDAFDLDPDVLARRYAAAAPALATAAARAALREAGVTPAELDAILISTCTGYLCPGLTSYVGEALGLRADVLALDLVGQGCGAALPNLRAAEALVASGREHVLCVCVEVCSAALYIDDDPGVLVSACLFGDGAGAAIVSSRPSAASRALRWRGAASEHAPAEREALRMEACGGLLRNVLSRQVPAIAGRHAARVLRSVLGQHELREADIRAWIWHAGGRTVLDRLRDCAALDEPAMQRSRAVLRRYGNLSSAFVFFVLEAALREKAPPGWWWMSSFGAGFSCHGALLEVA